MKQICRQCASFGVLTRVDGVGMRDYHKYWHMDSLYLGVLAFLIVQAHYITLLIAFLGHAVRNIAIRKRKRVQVYLREKE